MGILDREYYRDDSRNFSSGTSRICVTLIILNVIAFVLQILTRDQPGRSGWFERMFILDPDAVLRGEVWRLLTSAFLHDPSNIMHILFNMLFLWWFGVAVEDIYGKQEFLTFYLVAAVLSGMGFVLCGELIPETRGKALGASGAVSAVMVVFAMYFPKQTVLLFFVIPCPVWALVFFSVFKDLLILVGSPQTRIAVAGHLSGALFGFLYCRNQWRLLRLLPSGKRQATRRRNPGGLKLYDDDDDVPPPRQPEPARVAAPPPSVSASSPRSNATNPVLDEQLEAKMDEILDKVQKYGRESLTDVEKEILRRASEAIRKRLKS